MNSSIRRVPEYQKPVCWYIIGMAWQWQGLMVCCLVHSQVLDSIGVDIAASMQAAPGKRVGAAAQPSQEAEADVDDELVQRLAQLKS